MKAAAPAEEHSVAFFREEVAPILERHCVRCHSGDDAEGDVDLSSAAGVVEGRGDGWLVVPSEPEESYLLAVVSGEKPSMPKAGDRLSAEQITVLRQWISAGAVWPADVALKVDPLDWWSLRPLRRPVLPDLSPEDAARVQTPVDAFVLAELREQGLAPSPEADRRTLIRRLYHDLTGLPPTPGEVEAFVADPDPLAYEELVERLLASPRYGERWARHWLDVAHYADTHGYDKDKVRPNAWPYRDYVVRSFNADKPYDRFVKEQIAGDWFFPGEADGVVALGFVAAGPFDFVGQVEVGDGTMEKQRVRNIDRDDMVATTMNTFVSLTAQCARCHDHKFDPITQEDYYALQAVFAGVDRGDRPYDLDPATAERRLVLKQKTAELTAQKASIEHAIEVAAGPDLASLDRQIAGLTNAAAVASRPEYGYHSAIMPGQDSAKWVQVDLGRSVAIAEIAVVGAYDDFAGIGAGFGFPVRYRIEVSDDPEFATGASVAADETMADVPNPGIVPQRVALDGRTARYVRFTATKLAERQNDYIFALAEMSVLTVDGANAAAGAAVTALDSIEAPPRWGKANLVDGIYRRADTREASTEIVRLNERREALLKRTVDEATLRERDGIEQALSETETALKELPPQGTVYAAATDFDEIGNFTPTHGVPRPVFVLGRGDERNPLYEVGPGTVGCVPGLESRFATEDHGEARRRAALAEWIVDVRNPLTWRSAANRVWHYHFGRGIVETPNDFGRMGGEPTHPELLDWLAVEFRDGGRSVKNLHRLIVNSATYRQSSAHDEARARIDAGNRFLWRMNRQRLDAESVRDSILAVSGMLRHDGGGPGFRAFGFQDDHSPHYEYHEHDPDESTSHRRSIYRFIVRSVPDPFLTTLDCADPSLSVPRRNETLTPLQALSLLNNRFVVRMAERFADRIGEEGDARSQIAAAYRLALQRNPGEEELQALVPLCERWGTANLCRLLLNSNEFMFVD